MVAVVRAAAALAKPEMTELSLSAAASAEMERFSDEDTTAPNSSLSSAASSAGSLARRSTLSRLSFDCLPSPAVASSSSPPPPPSRPHRSGDAAWAAIRAAASATAAPLGPRDFKLLRRIGGGDIGTVYLCRLRRSPTSPESPLYAMKVVDRKAVAMKQKEHRAAAEKRILRQLDHPFLPTLYADFDFDFDAGDGNGNSYSCAVTEFCHGGDLHTLRHRLTPTRRFPLPAVRFYAGEILLALEYLHLIGVVYRDLKPENVLIRADGHVMLTDFDLSLQSSTSPTIIVDQVNDDEDDVSSSSSCFPLLRRRKRGRRGEGMGCDTWRVRVVVEARSGSMVGTHEYVAPEVASGGDHGAAVDWWAYGVFVYELLYGRTPFAGDTNEATLRNIVRKPLAFPDSAVSGGIGGGEEEAEARDLIGRLLDKDPAARLGSRRGAAEVKAHPFFRSVNLALLRSSRPPFVPGDGGGAAAGMRRSQSCKVAAPATKPAKKVYDGGRFDLF